MESQRSFLVIGLVLVSFLLWQQWNLDYGPKPTQIPESVTQTDTTDSSTGFVPQSQQSGDVPATPQQALVNTNLIDVYTDTLHVKIDPKGGDIVFADLQKFPVTQGEEESFHLLSQDPARLYIAQSGLVGRQGPDANPEGRPVYATAQERYDLEGDKLDVVLSFVNSSGMAVAKTFSFTPNSHEVAVTYRVINNTGQVAEVQQYAQLKQSLNAEGGSMFMPTYRGTAYSTQDELFEKLDFEDIQDGNLRETTVGGWVAMLEHYFVSAWVPPQEQSNNLYSRALNSGHGIIGFTGQSQVIPAGQTAQLSTTLYLGPKDQSVLAELSRGLDLTVDYGFLWWISQPLFSLLSFIHSLVNNWGVSIILITVLVKGLMYPLTKAQYTSMAKMRALQPKMAALKDRFGDDRQKMSQAMMELYKKEKVNPMGGCFPILLQMPIFLALYWVLLESVELRHADFALWITDLSVMDPFYVLPILTGASMFLLQKLQPMTIQDPMQQKIMQWMPVMMSVFFIWFPAGLVLYWFISNVITLVQAKIIYSAMEKQGLKAK